ncbi:hypothetical protein [Streptomyces atratus]
MSIKGDLLEGWFIAELRERLRNAPVVEHTYRAEVDLSDEIRRLRSYVADLLYDRRAGVFSTPEAVEVFRDEYRPASTRPEACERQPHKPGGWETRAAAQSMWDAWNVVSRGAWKSPGRLPGSCRGQLAATPTCEGGGC